MINTCRFILVELEYVEMLVILGRGNLENPEKNPWSMVRTNNKLNPRTCMALGQNQI